MQFENEQYDYVISGTSLYKSILSAALSRAGQKVLHVDPNSYYGSENEASFDLATFSDLNETQKGPKFDEFINDKSKNKKFVLDLCPRLLYANGSMVKLLVKSKICRYLEFRNVSGFYIEDEKDNKLISVPCSKSALFTTTNLSAIEKRKMMKFISDNSNDSEEEKEAKKEIDENTVFGEYLKTLDLTPKLEKYISSCLAFSSKEDTLKTVKHRIDLFLTSYGKYGQSAFLFPLYGNAELHQAFCRLSAVFGATFCLNYENPEKLKDTNKAKEFIFEDKKCQEKKLFKAAVIASEKLFKTDDKNDGVDLLILDDNVTGFQISGKGGNIAPVDSFVYYFSGPDLEVLKKRVEELRRDVFGIDVTIWYDLDHDHQTKKYLPLSPAKDQPSHIATILLKEKVECVFDYESEVSAAKAKFHELLGDDVEFLEAAPEPEDIIRDGGDK